MYLHSKHPFGFSFITGRVKLAGDGGAGDGGSGGAGDGAGDGDGGKSGAGDVFEFIDPSTGSKLPLPKKMKVADKDVDLQKLLGGVIGKTKKDVTQKLEETYKPILEKVAALEHKSDELTQLLQKAEDEKLSVEDRAKKERERESKKISEERDQAIAQAKHLSSTLETVIADNEILSAMGEFPEIINPGQLLQLVRLNHAIEVKLTNGNGRAKGTVSIKMIDEDGKEEMLPPKEAVEKLIAKPEYSHFLKSNLVAGGGSSSSSGARMGADGTMKYKRSALKDPKVYKEYSEKKMLGEKVSIIED